MFLAEPRPVFGRRSREDVDSEAYWPPDWLSVAPRALSRPASGATEAGGRRGGIGVDGQRRGPVHNAGGASSCLASRSAVAS
jgi:hypothetical protein